MASRERKKILPDREKERDANSDPRIGTGPSGACVCPVCGRSFCHRRGVPCTKMVCPSCGSPMMRK